MPFEAPDRHLAVPAWTGLQSGGRSAGRQLAALAFALALAGLIGANVGDGAPGAEADLVRLMKGMAILKGVLAAAASAVIGWRLTAPASPARCAAYLASAAAMAAGVALIWRMAAPGAAAILYHAGLIAAVLLLLRDRTIIDRLDAALLQRRALQARAERAPAPAARE
jgi:hypothetical protein